jgi:hypothetical protein
MSRLRAAAPGQRPHGRRAVVSGVPAELPGAEAASANTDLLDLSTLGPRRDLQPHRATVVPRLPATPGPVHRLRPRQVDPRRDHHRTAVRDVHQTRPVVLAQLPGMRRTRPAAFTAVRPLLAPATPARTAAPGHLHDPPTATGAARQPGRPRTTRDRAGLAEQTPPPHPANRSWEPRFDRHSDSCSIRLHQSGCR